MGVCSSCDSTSVATAKLIHEDGRLQEFSDSVRVSHILERNPSFFVCKADDLDFNEAVPAIPEADHLQPGQLYFLLPLSWSNCSISAQDMVALAGKASLALKLRGRGERCCGFRLMEKLDPILGVDIKRVKAEEEEGSPMVFSGRRCGGPVVNKRGIGRCRGGGGRRSSTSTKLSVIMED